MQEFVDATVTDEPDLTPMLDVVFIMLIFFIVTATFVKEQALNLPSVDKSQDSNPDNKSILIRIDSQSRYYFKQTFIDRRAIGNRLTRLHAELPGLPLVISPSPDASTDSVVHLMDKGKQLGMDVAFAASP